jgi:DNA-directed RNA polymerase specialized sigma24 family protein
MILDSKYIQYIVEMDPYTLENLMKEYEQDVWNFSFLLCKKYDMANDITQDIFLQAYRHVTSFRGEAYSAFIRKVLLVDLIQRTGKHLRRRMPF